jgi:hypothetical protein
LSFDAENVAMSKSMNPVLGSAAASAIVPKGYKAHPGSGQARADYQRVAIIVHHGMGQQVPYETIEGVANAIQTHAGEQPEAPVVRHVRLGVEGKDEVEPELVRAELRLKLEDDGVREHFDVHIYESYWAPLTEGQVTISDVIWFLLRAGWNGWLNTSCGTFQRWLFAQEHKFKLPKIWLMFVLTLLVALITSLVFINAVLAAAAASHAIGSTSAFPSGPMLATLTWDILLLDIAAVAVVLGIFVFGRWSFLPSRIVAWVLIYGAAIVIIAAAVLMALHLEGGLWPLMANSGWFAWVTKNPLEVLALWIAELLAAAAVRWALIEYVGDITAYIAAYSVSKFWKLRQDIRDAAMKVTRAVYRAKTDKGDDFLYYKIIVVGHSLGSVISYDTLNALLLESGNSDQPLHVSERTRMLLTFGSPLDKTAFLFRTLKDMHSEIREVGAAAVQPMIADYAYRPAEWVNLWARADIISGELDYYDPPTTKNARNPAAVVAVTANPKRINNVPDKQATTPLKAHVEYWKGNLLAAELWRAIST